MTAAGSWTTHDLVWEWFIQLYITSCGLRGHTLYTLQASLHTLHA